MSKKGCNDGCIHNKIIKLTEMQENYSFRCEATGTYMKEDDIKKTCKNYCPQYIIKIKSIEDFLD